MIKKMDERYKLKITKLIMLSFQTLVHIHEHRDMIL